MVLPLTPIRFLYRAADLYARKAAVISGDRTFTYAEFAERCERLASGLGAVGVKPGDRVACLCFNRHQLLEAYFGVPMVGAILLPLNVRLAASELSQLLEHSGASVLLYDGEFAPVAEQARAVCPPLKCALPLDGDSGYEELLAAGSARRIDWTGIDENSPAELFYTSGSTGTPKGVLLTHRALYLHGKSVALLMPEGDRTVVLQTIPLFHANGWGYPQAAALLGATQVMVRRFDAETVFVLIERHRGTYMCLVPTMAGALLAAPGRRRFDVSSMKHILIGGAASSPELIERMEQAFQCECLASYGLTEAGPVVTVGRPDNTTAPDSERYRIQAMAGTPIAGVELRVADSGGSDVPRDMTTAGEVLIRSDHVMAGYYNDPVGTEAALRDGWLYTGDMAVWDDEGRIHIVDRKKDIIVSGGENIAPIEIERAITAHPDVAECAVVAAPDEKWGEVPVAVIVPRPGATITAGDILELLRGRIAKFKMPRRIEFTDTPLPKTGSGKIRKTEIRARIQG
ncbi:MAG TPA: long-chain-fatty-acid--CoA ligase [Bryobacteraceae bacterium]|nr:long-chain-fatty-acid--CoA ligase [Bryobacteraceae bacterium]